MKLEHLYETNNLKRVVLRDKPTSTSYHIKGELIGWFRNKQNPNGWGIFALNNHDKEFMKDHNISTNNVYRVASDITKTTNLVKFNFKTGTYAFANSKALEDENDLRFDRASAYRNVIVEPGMEKYFK